MLESFSNLMDFVPTDTGCKIGWCLLALAVACLNCKCQLHIWAQCVESIAGKQARLVGMDGGIPGVPVRGH